MLEGLRSFLWLLSRSWLGILGAIVTTTGFVLEIVLLAWGHFAHAENPYVGMVTFAIMPGVIGGGLGIIPLGLLLAARKAGGGKLDLSLVKRLAAATNWEFLARLGVIVGMASAVNLIFFTAAGYEGYHYMDTQEFCGLVCHQVMEPEYVVYARSPHSNVRCVECHIGPGVTSFAKAKINGARQMVGVFTGHYSRPIEAPVKTLRPADEICLECHDPKTFEGTRLEIIQHFAEDEQNSRRYTVLNLRIGASDDGVFPSAGIHSHVDGTREVRYQAGDEEWDDVLTVSLTDTRTGATKTWRRADTIGKELHVETERRMDCIDCHNRAAHDFVEPVEALEERMLDGDIDPTIPWIRLEAFALLSKDHASEEDAKASFETLSDRYATAYPDVWAARSADIEEAEGVLLETWRTFVWPSMDIKWGTYEARDTHEGTSAGCFRCHREEMVDEAGEPINSQCESCHYVLAEDDPNPDVFECLHRERQVVGLY